MFETGPTTRANASLMNSRVAVLADKRDQRVPQRLEVSVVEDTPRVLRPDAFRVPETPERAGRLSGAGRRYGRVPRLRLCRVRRTLRISWSVLAWD